MLRRGCEHRGEQRGREQHVGEDVILLASTGRALGKAGTHHSRQDSADNTKLRHGIRDQRCQRVAPVFHSTHSPKACIHAIVPSRNGARTAIWPTT